MKKAKGHKTKTLSNPLYLPSRSFLRRLGGEGRGKQIHFLHMSLYYAVIDDAHCWSPISIKSKSDV